VHLTHLTRQAEKQLKKLLPLLSGDDQHLLLSTLLHPIPADACTLVRSHTPVRVFRHLVPCAVPIRVCYRLWRRKNVVVLDVAKHNGSDRPPGERAALLSRPIPMKESSVMKKQPKIASNGTDGSKVRQSPTAPATVPAASVAGTELLSQAITLVSQDALQDARNRLSDEIRAMMSLGRDLETRVHAQEGRISTQVEALQELELSLVQRLERVEQNISDLSSNITTCLERLQAETDHLRSELRMKFEPLAGENSVNCTALLDARLAPVEGLLAEQQRALAELAAAACGTDLARDLAATEDRLQADFGTYCQELRFQQDAFAARLDRVESGIRQLSERFANCEQIAATKVSSLQTTLATWGERLDRTEGGLETVTAVVRDESAQLHVLATLVDSSLSQLRVELARFKSERERCTLKARLRALLRAAGKAFSGSEALPPTR
jgi:predicted  nucleic acid-binding Zn-ribbon protein